MENSFECSTPHQEVYMKEFNHTLQEKNVLVCSKTVRLTENIEGERKPDVVCYGDVHQAFVQNFRGKTLCNAGSVGNPLEITQASYLIFEGTYNKKKQQVFPSSLYVYRTILN